MVSSPFLLNNKVKLKVPRPPTTPKTGEVVLNFIKKLPNKPSNSQQTKSPNPNDEIFPYFLKDEDNDKPKNRSKRWVPIKDPRQLPQEDLFLNFIHGLSNESPIAVNDSPPKQHVPGIESIGFLISLTFLLLSNYLQNFFRYSSSKKCNTGRPFDKNY